MGYLQDEDEDLIPLDDGEQPPPVGPPRKWWKPNPAVPPPSIDDAPLPGKPTLDTSIPSVAQGVPLSIRNPIVAKREAAEDALAAQKNQQPGENKPKWWQRLAAAGVGAAAGYVNAEGKMRHPIDASGAVDTIMGGPQQRQKVAAWQRGVEGAQANVDAAKANEGAWWKNQSLENDEQYKSAQEERLRAQATRESGRNDADAAKSKQADAEKQDQLALKGREDAYLMEQGAKAPEGWDVIQSAANPGKAYAAPPRFAKLPPELVDYAPGRKAGDVVPASEIKAARDTAHKIMQNSAKPLKPEAINAVQLAIRAAGGDPDNPATITPAIASKASSILKPSQTGGIQLTPEAIAFWGQAAANGVPLPSMGMGASGAKAREQIINAAPGAAGGHSLTENKTTLHADAGSLTNMQKMRDAVVSFENTANANLDLFVKQAKPIIDSGSPLINQPLRAIDRRALGSAELSAYDAARRIAINEVAKVTSNPTLSGQLSDSARHEVEGLIPEEATLAQVYHVVSVLKQDMANRHKFLDQSVGEIKGRISGGGRGGQQNVGGGKITVVAGDGSIHPFDNDQQAKIFENSVKQAGGTTKRQ